MQLNQLSNWLLSSMATFLFKFHFPSTGPFIIHTLSIYLAAKPLSELCDCDCFESKANGKYFIIPLSNLVCSVWISLARCSSILLKRQQKINCAIYNMWLKLKGFEHINFRNVLSSVDSVDILFFFFSGRLESKKRPIPCSLFLVPSTWSMHYILALSSGSV